MQFKANADVSTSDGQEVGKVDRVVIDPVTKETTHIIVRKGVFFTEDKVVPISLVDEATDDHIALRGSKDDFKRLPIFEETHFIALDSEEAPGYSLEHARPMYWYPFGSGTGLLPYIPLQPQLVEIKRNIPEHTVALKEGATVISADGRYVGEIERVFVDPETERVTTFLVSKGFVLKEYLFVPVEWVAEFGEDEIRLAVGWRLLEQQLRLIENTQELDKMRK